MRKQTNLYDKDFYAWAMTQADLIKLGRFENIDIKNIAEEIETLGRSERSAIRNHLVNLIMHMLKVLIQPEKHTRSWDLSIFNSRDRIQECLKDSPSLKPYLKEIIIDAFIAAKKKATIQTGIDEKKFPIECPWTINEILKG